MSRLKRLLVEVHRRSLWQLLGSYVVGAWLVLQLAETLASLIGLPLWFGASVIALLAFGFLLALTTGLVKVVAALQPGATGQRSGLHRLFNWKNASIAGVVALAVLVVGTAGYMGMRAMGIGPAGTLMAKGILAERDRIVLADFENHAADSTLALTATEALRIDLDQSPVVRVAEPDYVAGALARMARSADGYVDYETARELAIREGLKAVIAGEVRSVGDSYMLSVRLVAAEDGEVLTSLRETASDSSKFIPAIDRLSNRLRERVGESLRSIRASEPLEQVTTASLEALSLYSEGRRATDDFRRIELWEDAITLDTAFAMAYRGLGARLRYHGDVTRSSAYTARAYDLRERLTTRERCHVEAWYHMNVRGEIDESINAYRRLLETYPEDGIALNNLAGQYYTLRDLVRAEELVRRAIEADSTHSYAWQLLFTVVMDQGRLEEAEQLHARWGRHVPTSISWYTEAASLAVNRGDYAAAEEFARRRRERTGETRASQLVARVASNDLLADLAAAQGRLAEAERYLRDAMADLWELGRPADYLAAVIEIAMLDVWYRADTASAFHTLEAALDKEPFDSIPILDRPYLQLTRFYAYAGRTEHARALLEEYESAVNPPLRPLYGRTHNRLVGIVALSEGQLDEAIEQLGTQDRYRCSICALAALGWAYELAGQPDSAIAAYRRYAETPHNWRLVASGNADGLKDALWLPVVYERLGALHEQRADTANAIRYYGKLIELWKNADPELQPRVEAARRAIEALRSDT
jgi:tetratricopeptide (TPR) repeat protein